METLRQTIKTLFQLQKSDNVIASLLKGNSHDDVHVNRQWFVRAYLDDISPIRTKDQVELSDADIDELKSGKEKLMNASQKVFAKVYEQAQAAQGAQGQAGPGPDMGAGAADDVVDGDYREV